MPDFFFLFSVSLPVFFFFFPLLFLTWDWGVFSYGWAVMRLGKGWVEWDLIGV